MNVIGEAFQTMSNDMRYKLMGYQESLQMRYGDPRVYAMQEEAMAADRAAVMHAHVKNREEALAHTYRSNRAQIREAHTARISQQNLNKRPQSLAPSQRQTAKRPSDLPPAEAPTAGDPQ